MISERLLRKWRKQALYHQAYLKTHGSSGILDTKISLELYIDKVLKMTQELLDLHLMKKGKRDE